MNGNRKKIAEAIIKSRINKAEFERRVKGGATPTERLHIYRELQKQNRERTRSFCVPCSIFLFGVMGSCACLLILIGGIG